MGDLLIVVATFIAASAAIAAAIVAGKQASVAKATYEAQMQPYVYADIRGASHSRQLFAVHVANGGPTVATNVVLSFSPMLQPDVDMRRDPIEKWEIASLTPGASLERILGFGPRVLDANENGRVKIRISFIGFQGQREILEYDYDFQSVRMTSASGKTLSDIGYSLEKIAKHFDS